MIKIIHPPSYINERKYIHNVIFNHWLGLEYSEEIHGLESTILILPEENEKKRIVLDDGLFSIPRNKWLSKESLPKHPTSYVDLSLMPFRDSVFHLKLPIIFGKKTDNIKISEDNIHLGIDILGSIFFMISRYEEIVKQEYDMHERFFSNSSFSSKEKLLNRPIVNEYLDFLCNLLKILCPNLKFKKRSYNLFLTHDVDCPFSLRKKPIIGKIKTSMADLLIRKDLLLFSKRILFSSFSNDIKNDPNNTFDFIMDTSEKNDIKSSFYFISGNTAGFIDGDYNLDMPIVRQLMKNIYERGHEIGLHPSYNTYIYKENLKMEFENLLRVAKLENIKQEYWGGRQHYLRWRAPETWQIWEDIGLNYDSTLSYADHVGFRCGVCYDFPVFNLLTSQQLKLIEVPLIVMEGSLLGKEYQNMNLNQSYEAILELYKTVKFFKGTYTLLWHNDMLIASQQKEIYREVIKNIA